MTISVGGPPTLPATRPATPSRTAGRTEMHGGIRALVQPAPSPQPPWWRDGRVWLLVALTLLTLMVGWQHKQQCHERSWDGYQWREMCYSDIQALWGTRGAGDGLWPYVETFNEYPPVTGLFMHAMASVADSRDGYLAVTAAALSVLAVVTTVLLAELVGRDRKVLYWAVAPALALYAFYNWDLLAVAPAVGALLAFRKGHMGLAGALLALGASAKLFPAFLAPALGMWILREDGGLRRRGWSFGLSFVAMWLAWHLPLFLLDADGLVEAYRFHAGRDPNFETVWFSLGHLGRSYGWPFLARWGEPPWHEAANIVLVAALAASAWAAWTRRLDPVAAATVPVFAFLAFNKVFSIQYTLWAIPLLVAIAAPRTLKALVVVADLAVFVTLGAYFALWDTIARTGDPNAGHLFTPVAIAALFRAAVFAAVAVHLLQTARRRAPIPDPAPVQEVAG